MVTMNYTEHIAVVFKYYSGIDRMLVYYAAADLYILSQHVSVGLWSICMFLSFAAASRFSCVRSILSGMYRNIIQNINWNPACNKIAI